MVGVLLIYYIWFTRRTDIAGHSFGTRHLLAVTPACYFFAVVGLARLRSRFAAIVFVLLMVVGGVYAVAGMRDPWSRIEIEGAEGAGPRRLAAIRALSVEQLLPMSPGHAFGSGGGLLEHLLASGLEFRPRLPLGVVLSPGDAQADVDQQPDVLDGPREVPVGLHLVADLVVVVLGVLVALLLAVIGGLADVVIPPFGSRAGTPCLANSKWSER